MCCPATDSKHLYNLNLLPQYQSSYQADFSTETLPLKLMDDILKGMGSQEVTALVALDLSAAFYSQPQSITGHSQVPLWHRCHSPGMD